MVTTNCVSACTIAFLGGKHRWVTGNARLGFHAPSYGAQTLQDAEDKFRINAVASGVARPFIDRALKDRTIWYPTSRELITAHVITGVLEPDKKGVE